MAIKDVVLHYAQDSGLPARLETALMLTRRFDAHLIAVHAMSFPVMPGIGFGGMVAAPQLIEAQYQALRAAVADAEQAFNAIMAREGGSAEWRSLEGDAIDAMTVSARYGDIAVVGQANPDAPTAYDRMADHLVLAAGRPVLVVPYIGANADGLGRRILVAWNGSREASRAVHDAMPFLERAEEVLVFSVNPPDDDPIAAADLAAHLARHGVRATAHHAVAPDIDVGAVLLSAAADHDIDLLVMGGYGHSRLRELALGGATRHLLQSMTVPVLMSH